MLHVTNNSSVEETSSCSVELLVVLMALIANVVEFQLTTLAVVAMETQLRDPGIR